MVAILNCKTKVKKNLNSAWFEFTEVFYQTDTGVDLFHIQNNNIKYVKTHE